MPRRQIRTWNGEPFKIWFLRIVTQECKRPLRYRAQPGESFTRSGVEIGLAVLSPDERIICVLADVLGVNEDDIAEIMRASIHTIRTTRSRARRQIRDVLQINGAASREHACLAKG